MANINHGPDSVMSSALSDELWSDGDEEPVAMETYENDTTQGIIMYSDIKN